MNSKICYLCKIINDTTFELHCCVVLIISACITCFFVQIERGVFLFYARYWGSHSKLCDAQWQWLRMWPRAIYGLGLKAGLSYKIAKWKNTAEYVIPAQVHTAPFPGYEAIFLFFKGTHIFVRPIVINFSLLLKLDAKSEIFVALKFHSWLLCQLLQDICF